MAENVVTKKSLENYHVSDYRHSLQLLTLVSNRISHSIRTPLGVCMGLINDHLQGYKLEEDDYRDAKAALERLVKMLDHLITFGRERAYTYGNTVLLDYLNTFKKELELPDTGPEVTVKLPRELPSLVIDNDAYIIALKNIFAYIKSALNQLTDDKATFVNVEVFSAFGDMQDKNSKVTTLIVVDYPVRPYTDLCLSARPINLIELAEHDQRIEALGLLFAEAAMRGEGGRVQFCVTETHRGMFRIFI